MTIERLARALDTDPDELLTLAGRATTPASRDRLLREIRALRAEVRDGFARMEAAINRK